VKTITIRLPDVEAAMLGGVQKVKKAYRDLQGLLLSQIQQEYAKTPAAKPRGKRSLSQVSALPIDAPPACPGRRSTTACIPAAAEHGALYCHAAGL